ncbi:MAG TPA: cytochrome c biogenesis protein CcdC [Lentibacillus sp.]|uniref:CcdC family protein n=1 Tax=Lentibacillus sp. TaxID=1925746 RepID=UPI002B4B1D93|nr:cytochrome c biogenesis protein CcdC [Lentibacillus sp.]HLR63063.1 cytochrome c biogenesis protein CcdC [Lentibacillus sp.]
MFWLAASTIIAAIMATSMIFIRLKASKKPASVKKIILPPLFMSTGAFMFLFPVFRVELLQVFEAVLVGVIFSVFLIKTSKFEIKGGSIYLIPSKSFVFILFGLLLVRIIIKLVIGSTISLGEMSGMFFLLAFGMIFSWRLAMLYKFKQMEKKLE